MKITLYELLGLIKDNKSPKKVKYKDIIYTFINRDYSCGCSWLSTRLGELFGKFFIKEALDEEVEIISEESNEWEDIEEVDFLDGFNDSYYDTCLMKMGEICNQLIKNQNYLKERLENKESD